MRKPQRGDKVALYGNQLAEVTDVPDFDNVCRVTFLNNRTSRYVLQAELERNFTAEQDG